MGTDLILLIIGNVIAAWLAGTIVLDVLAEHKHWRVGRWGILLSLRRKRGGCLRCGTDWLYALPHDTPIRAEDGWCVFPLCEKCWQELPKQGRLGYYAAMMEQWRASGRMQPGTEEWDDARVAIYAAVEAGL